MAADGTDPHADLTVETAPGLAAVDRAAWDALANPPLRPFDPFVSWDFLEALERSGAASRAEGWAPQHLLVRDGAGALVGAAPMYLKGHSYGEYVFDHSWADALHRAGGRYYPKLQGAAPFTPATGRRLLTERAEVEEALVGGAVSLAEQARASSVHFTFLTEGEWRRLGAMGLLQRTGVQFHWSNAGYRDFADFLDALAGQKRKNLRKERERAQAEVQIRALTGSDLTEAAWDVFFACYMDTGSRKWGSPYLNRATFSLLGERMADKIVLFLAEQDGRPVASALNFLGGECLYGRYWGRIGPEIPFLHFELCYYQAIELAITRGLARVEAGAQGEHKLARGYAPAPTYSAHWIAHPGLRRAVGEFLKAERPAIAHEIDVLDEHTPFKRLEAGPDQAGS